MGAYLPYVDLGAPIPKCDPGCGPGFSPHATGKCLPCGPGTAKPVLGRAECQVCPAGTFKDLSGAGVCQPCPIGTYSGEERAGACSACPNTTSTLSTGSVHATQCFCAAGTYLSETSPRCNPCPSGETSLVGSTHRAACRPILPCSRVLAQGNSRHFCAFENQYGVFRCWGRNDQGQLGLGDGEHRGRDSAPLSLENHPAVDVGTINAVAVSVGGYHTCARLEDGSLRCWGRNWQYQLGNGDRENRGKQKSEMGGNLPAVDLGFGCRVWGVRCRVVALSASNHHVCAILAGGVLKCWGYNGYGQLGYGDTTQRGDGNGEMGTSLPGIEINGTAVSAGYYHTCALLVGGSVKCWGQNGYGQLGLGDTTQRGDGSNEMGIYLPSVDLDGTAVAIESGYHFSCALLTGGSVKCWGANDYGQLGQGTATSAHRGDAANELGTSLPGIELDGPALAISAGYYHACALLEGGFVKCWGSNSDGQLGYGDVVQRGDAENHMGTFLPAVDLNGTAVAITCFKNFNCALLESGLVKCWGDNAFGQLGIGDTTARGSAADQMGGFLPAVNLNGTASRVVLGESHACAQLADGAVKCWGNGADGRLGQNDGQSRGDAVNEMGVKTYPAP